ncbi:3-hydroxyacyl-CoA dehydrogenase family protein [Chloroflexota bacterium]
MKKVGVVGCGLMGSGIVQVCAQSGYDVVTSEINDELLKKGLGLIDASLTKGIEKGKVTREEKEAIIGRIKGITNMQDFSDCNLVIEAAVEKIDIKKSICAELDKFCPKDTILATNSSCLSVIDIASATKRQEKVLGIHFFNPAPVMKLVEVVRSVATSEETLNIGKRFAESLKKTVVLVPDVPGFIVNRLLLPFLADAMRMLESGVATREDIDNGVVLGLGHPMGPLALADFVGNDTNLFILDSMYEVTKDPRCIAPVILRKMVAAGYLGRKTGKGFYDYK